MRSFIERVQDAHVENLKWVQDVVNDTAESIEKRLDRSIADTKDSNNRLDRFFDRWGTDD